MQASLRRHQGGTSIDADESRDYLAHTLPVVLWLVLLGCVASAIVALANAQNLTAAGITSSAVLAGGALALTRRGRLRLASIAFLANGLLLAAYLLAVGSGLRDLGLLVYPLILVVGGVLLEGAAFGVLLGLCLGSLPLGTYGHARRHGGIGPGVQATELLYVTIVLAVTAAAVWLLSSALRRSLREARTSERALRASEASFTIAFRSSPVIMVITSIDDARVLDVNEAFSAATGKMQRMLDELLELSRVGRVASVPAELRLSDLALEAVALVRGRLDRAGVVVEVAPDLPTVWGDRSRLLVVLQNLLDNAVKFMGEQKQPRIEVGSRRGEDGSTILCVRDNGSGIDPRHHRKVFELFEKLDPGSEGTGLGLALVKRIIETHKGTIWVESQGVGHGTTFCFTLADSLSEAGAVATPALAPPDLDSSTATTTPVRG
jgi:signal transduction histidine kinase